MRTYLEIAPNVLQALQQKRPVVALESTIISHGFQYPKNLECAMESERILTENGVTPATIGIVKGVIKVGLSEKELQAFAQSPTMAKASRRDMAPLVAGEKSGATTVAATMMAASMAGIRIFATGGIGGVHRGATHTFDISADLEELAQTDVAVVCAGAKSILDIPLTREYLETAGVCVVGYRTREFPSFYTQKSGTKTDYQMDTPEEIARMLAVKKDLNIKGGTVIANPIPEESALEEEFINDCIKKALVESFRLNVRGKDQTPFILKQIHELSGGKSEEANQALVYNNVLLAAQIAAALSEMESSR